MAEISTHLTDPTDADSDDDGLNDSIEINTYLTDPLSADTSGDGFSDGFIVGEGLDPTDDFSTLRSNVISDIIITPNDYGLYLPQEIQDLRPGSTLIEVSDNLASIQLDMEESSDLESWTETDNSATIDLSVDSSIKFIRLKMGD